MVGVVCFEGGVFAFAGTGLGHGLGTADFVEGTGGSIVLARFSGGTPPVSEAFLWDGFGALALTAVGLPHLASSSLLASVHWTLCLF